MVRVVNMKKIYFRKISRGIYQLEKKFAIITRLRPYTTVQTGCITLDVTGLLILEPLYVSDGPSGPTLDTKSSIRGAFVHDALYRLMRRGLLDLSYRKDADEEIRDLCIEDKMYKWRANLWYRMLRIAGEKNAIYNKKDCLILCAPY